MSNLKKVICLLAVLSAAQGLFACGDTPDTVGTDTSASDTAVSNETDTADMNGYLAPNFEDLDFGGEELRIAAPNYSPFNEFFPEDMTGDTFNDAAYMRIANVENTLNVKIVSTFDDTGISIHETVKRSVTAGDDAFDIVLTHCIYGIGDYVTGNMLYNLDELPNLDLEKPWWNQNLINTYRIGMDTYYAAGDLLLSAPSVVYFNKTISADNDLPDHYECVRQGAWTYDVFLSEIKSVSVDLNGDGKMDGTDKVGISGDMTECLSALAFGCGVRLTDVTDDGLVLDFFSDKVVDIYTKTYDVFMDKSVSQIYFRHKENVIQNFEENRALFGLSNTKSMIEYRDYAVDFGVLPMPKYDENQEEYQCLVWTEFCCVPTTVQRTDLVGACLEQLAYESTAVKDAYIENLIRGKSTRDLESLEMLDIIYDSQVGDIGMNYLGFDNSFHPIFYCYYDLMSAKNTNITSFYEKKKDGAIKVLENLYEKIIENQEMNEME